MLTLGKRREPSQRQVTRAEFREAAVKVGWQLRTIELFLAPGVVR